MESTIKAPFRRRLSQNKLNQDFFKVSDTLLSNLDEFSGSNKQLPQQSKDFNFLSVYYNKKSGNKNFLDKISHLNKKFYNESDKYVKSKQMLEKINDDLYLNLFQQINCYVEEIERLNKKISTNNNQEFKTTIDKLNKDIIEKKEKIRNYEIKIREKTTKEEKLMKEIESYKRRIIFYKDKIKIGLLARNRNDINMLGRQTNNRGENRKRTSKAQENCLSPAPMQKNKSFQVRKRNKRDLSVHIRMDPNHLNKIIYENGNEDNNYNENKKVNKTFKSKESMYIKTDKDNQDLINRIDYDNDGKDNEDKYDEYNNDFNNKTIPNKSTDNKKSIKGHSENYSNGFFNALTKELYGSPQIESNNTVDFDSNKNIGLGAKDDNSFIIFDKNNEEEKERAKTLKRNTKGRSVTNKIKKPKRKKKESNAKDNNKSKILNTTNKTDKNNINDNNSKSKNKQINIDTKYKSKNSNISKEKTANFTQIKSPLERKKYKVQSEKEKKIPHSNKSQSSLDNSNEKGYRTNDLSQGCSGSNKINNKKLEYNKRIINNNNNHISNLNVVSGKNNYTCSKLAQQRKYNEKVDKDLLSIFKDVNDDYLNSIEQLRRQEDQIKYMLKFLDLDEK